MLDTARSVSSNTPSSERARESQERGLHDGNEMKTPSSGVFGADGGRGQGERDTKRSPAAGRGARMEIQDVLGQQAEGAAAATATAPADPARETTVVDEEHGTQDYGGALYEGQTVGVSRSRGSGGGVGDDGAVVGSDVIEGLVAAWGLSDPMVARAMMKRAKRLRKFQTAEVREVDRGFSNHCCRCVCDM